MPPTHVQTRHYTLAHCMQSEEMLIHYLSQIAMVCVIKVQIMQLCSENEPFYVLSVCYVVSPVWYSQKASLQSFSLLVSIVQRCYFGALPAR